jgi:hypothetical protein
VLRRTDCGVGTPPAWGWHAGRALRQVFSERRTGAMRRVVASRGQVSNDT